MLPFIQAERFLNVFGEESGQHTFQTFHDKGGGQGVIFHGTINECYSDLNRLNQSGHGIFFMVNGGDGKGRKSENVTNTRAVFADFDTPGGLKRITSISLTPHVIVESSPGKYHAYWFVRDMPLDQFTPTQKSIATMLASDPAVCDLPRVMRLPGFYHLKGKPFMTHIVEMNV